MPAASPTPLPPAPDTCAALIARLRSLADPRNVEGMARFGISPVNALGVSVTTLRGIARESLRGRKDALDWRHDVADCLWESGVHEARLLATLLEAPARVTRTQALEWASDSDSWDITDGLCLNLLDKTSFAHGLPAEWASSEHEFVKRAAFALVAGLAWHDKAAPDDAFRPYLDLIRREAHDPRNFVKKAVNWALRHIGKRSAGLHPHALRLAEELAASDDRTERWVGRDAVRELTSEKVRARLGL